MRAFLCLAMLIAAACAPRLPPPYPPWPPEPEPEEAAAAGTFAPLERSLPKR